MKHVFFILSSIISFLALFLYLIEILSSDTPFDIVNFLRSFASSFPFLLVLTLVDYKLVLFLNHSEKINKYPCARIGIEILLVVVLAILFIIIGNIPFYDGILVYIESESYKQSMIAAILINIFTITTIEYIVQIKKNEKLVQENLQIQYKELKNQINPHFLFNSLNILVSLINKDPQQAIQYTKKLSEIYRYVLSGNNENIILLEEEIKFIRDYIEILQIRYGKGLQVEFSIKEKDLERHIIPMSMQVLIENAVKHNAVSSSRPLTINISSDHHHLNVSNGLIPRTSVEPGTGIGIKNLDKKYQIISGKHIEIQQTKQTFTVKLPLL